MADELTEAAPTPPRPSKGVALSNWLVGAASGFLSSRTTRRGFLVRSAMTGSAVAVAGCAFAGKPGGAYQRITDCPPGSLCRDGYTEFCCSINGGYNSCPPGTIPAGWWRASSNVLCGGTRYYIDCNQECCGPRQGAFCAGCTECTCGPTCNHRKVYCNYFRYGQCHQEIGVVGPIACRVSTCVPPWELDAACTSANATDQSTAGHVADCLFTGPPPPPAPPPASTAFLPSSGAVVSPGPGQLLAFVRAVDGALWYQALSGGSWSGWSSLGGALTSGIGAAVVAGTTYVFVRGPDNGLWYRSLGGGGWSGWNDLGGGLGSDPVAVADGSGGLYVFVRGSDWRLWYRKLGSGGWSAWNDLDGAVASRPAAVVDGSGALYVFVRATNNGLWYRRLAPSGWSAWNDLDGSSDSAPSAVVDPSGAIYAFVRGTDTRLWYQRYAGGWSGWNDLDGYLTSDPIAVSHGSGVFAFVRGPDGGLWYRNHAGGWSDWTALSGGVAADPAVGLIGSDLYAFVAATDGALWYRSRSGGSWGAWQSLGGALAPVLGA